MAGHGYATDCIGHMAPMHAHRMLAAVLRVLTGVCSDAVPG